MAALDAFCFLGSGAGNLRVSPNATHHRLKHQGDQVAAAISGTSEMHFLNARKNCPLHNVARG